MTRASKWDNTDFANKEYRINRVKQHKQDLMNETFKLAECYERRKQQEKEAAAAAAKKKIEDNSEYASYLKVAKNGAECAKTELMNREAKQTKTIQLQREEQEYADFVKSQA